MSSTGNKISDFRQFRDEHLHSLPEGSKVLHVMPFPDHYPFDLAAILECKEKDTSLRHLIPEEYLNFARKLKERSITLGRLVITRAAHEEGFLPENNHLSDLAEIYAPLHEVGEIVRIAWFGEQYERLMQTCGRYNKLADNYTWGLARGIPRESLWSVRTPDNLGGLAVQAVWHNSYQIRESTKVFDGGPVITPPFDDSNSDALAYERFWHCVYISDQSMSFPTALHVQTITQQTSR